jgi:hypothetical protein
MALILLAVLLLLGAAGMAWKRGIILSAITAAILCATVLPLILTESGPSGALYRWSQGAMVLVMLVVAASASFFAGHFGRRLFLRMKKSEGARP